MVEQTKKARKNRVLVPDRYLESVVLLTPDWLRANGIEALLLDIDNTLVSRATQQIPDDVRAWIDLLIAQDFKLHLITNNWHKVVLQTAENLLLPIIYKAMKPLPISPLRALRRLGVKRHQTILVGDQMMTDIFAAKLLRMRSALVQPLTQTDLTHTKLLRNVEKILLGARQPEADRSELDGDGI
ncbi:MAG: YqeG family HAD IIIA-type phosphatase [Coriobacteriia bacterium]|nr:YqeG family HAD IIIA-type phosphatase [Coriobacteriia bacterium]